MTVNHAQRRSRLADVVVDIIAREGLEAATVRRIADVHGYSTSAVTYYFADKQELLLGAYQSLADELEAKLAVVKARDPGDLVGCLMCMTAADEVSIKRWRAYVALWDRAARDHSWAAREAGDIETALLTIEAFIRVRSGEIAGMREISRNLNAFIQGISVQVLINPAYWPPERIREAIDLMVRKLLD